LSEEQAFTGFTHPLPTHPKRIEHLISEDLEGMDETIWVDARSGSSFSLNIVASAILELCDGEHTEQDMATIISETCSADMSDVLNDTQGMIIVFYRSGLLQFNA